MFRGFVTRSSALSCSLHSCPRTPSIRQFVKEENRAALEARGRGELRHVLVFALDKTSYTALPEWMREINVVRHLSSAKACARCIQSCLMQLQAELSRGASLYLGREEDEKQLRRALAVPRNSTPI